MEREETKLWIFCHPAISQEVQAEIEKAIVSVGNEQGEQGVTSTSTGGNEAEGTSGVTRLATSRVSLRCLKDELVRFRVLGPRSHALLMETLKPAFGKLTEEGQEAPMLESSSLPDIPRWWEDIEQLRVSSDMIVSCHNAFKSASSPSEFSRGTVIGMVVLDPRLFTPSRRTDMVSAFYPKKKSVWEEDLPQARRKQHRHSDEDSESEASDSDDSYDQEGEGEEGEEDGGNNRMSVNLNAHDAKDAIEDDSTSIKSGQAIQLTNLPEVASFSPIWDKGIRKIVSASRTPEHLLNQLRSTQLNKTSTLNVGDKAARIPVLLVQQLLQAPPPAVESSSRLTRASAPLGSDDIGAGWDLILPASWATAFWVALCYRGARACGMRELKRCSLEALVPHFPEDFPDTAAGQRHSETLQQSLVDKYKRHPPDKRRNYGKLLIPSPCRFPWEDIIRDWGRDCRVQPFLGCQDEEDEDKQLEPQPSKRPRLDPVPTHSTAIENVGSAPSDEAFVFEQQVKQMTVNEAGDEAIGGKAIRLGVEHGHVPGDEAVRSGDVVGQGETAVEPEGEGVGPEDKAVVAGDKAIGPRSEIVNASKCDITLPLFYVIRSRETLSRIDQFLVTLWTQMGKQKATSQPFLYLLRAHCIDQSLRRLPNALIHVKLEALRCGTVSESAMLCLPNSMDLSLLVKDRTFDGPLEMVHPKGVTVVEGNNVHVGITSLTLKQFKQRRKELNKEKVAAAESEGKALPNAYSCSCRLIPGLRVLYRTKLSWTLHKLSLRRN